MLEKLKLKAIALKKDSYALYLAARDPRTPWYVKFFVAGLAAYAFSPIDLIPDFIPILGYLDDILLLPIGIALAIKMVPQQVLVECRLRAKDRINGPKPVSRVAGAVVIAIWLLLFALCAVWVKEVAETNP